MIMAAQLSGLADADMDRLRSLIARAGLPVAPPVIPADDFMQAMRRDKKVENSALRFVLLKELGSAYVSSAVDADRLQQICGAGS